MSISSEINRISGNIEDSLTAVASKGITVPSGSNSDDLAGLIAQIPNNYSVALNLTGASSSATTTKVVSGGSYFTEITPTTEGHKISSITVTMGGLDITSQVFKSGVGAKAITANGTYNASSDNLSGYSSVVVSVPSGGPALITKSITENGTYTATDDNADGYSSVTVNVPGGGGTGAVSVVDTLDTHGGTIRTITAVDISDTTAEASDVAQGKYFYTADGTKTAGTSSGGGGGGGFISLVDTITLSADTRSVSIDLSTYLSNYNMLIITQNLTLSQADWLYYIENGDSPTGGTYNDGSKISHAGVCFWYFPLGGSSKYVYGYPSTGGFTQKNTTNTPISNLYIYTYASSKMIVAGSSFNVYGGNYAS